MSFLKPRRWQSKEIMASAKGEQCLLRLPCCNGNPETTVCCHISFSGGGMGTKPSDTEVAYGCSDCHAYIDQHKEMYNDRVSVSHEKARAMQQTRQILLDKGLIRI